MILNKTYKYLSPLINGLNKLERDYLTNSWNSIKIMAVSDIDYLVAYKTEEIRHCLFIVFDINGEYISSKKCYKNVASGRKQLSNLLSYFKKSKYYVTDYLYKEYNTPEHVLVLKLPEQMYEAWENFMQSKYSKMYNDNLRKQCLEPLYKHYKNSFEHRYFILTKDEKYRKTFENIINKEYNTTIVLEDDREFDFPIKLEDEILNFKP